MFCVTVHVKIQEQRIRYTAHSNHVTSSKRADTLICHTTMRTIPINALYNLGHVTL